MCAARRYASPARPESFKLLEVGAVDVERIGDVGVLSDADWPAQPLRDTPGNDPLEVGEGVHIHKRGLEGIVAADVDVHH